MSPAAPGGPEPVFTVSGAARRLGIPAGTLRTWERRHGIGPSGRSPGGHRRYTASDLARLRAMRELVENGIPPAQAAELASLASPGGTTRLLAASDRAARPVIAEQRLAERSAPGSELPDGVPPQVSAALVIRAAEALDAPLLVSMLSGAFARHGVTAGWQQLAVPALREVGARPPSAAGHGAAEHMLSGCLLAALLDVITRAPAARGLRPVLLGCAEEEQHVLPVYALHAELACRGVDVRQLGSRVPRRALAHAAGAVHPAAVFLWSQVPGTANPALLDGLPPGVRLVAGGPGWRWSALPDGVHLAGALDQAAELLTESAYGPP